MIREGRTTLTIRDQRMNVFFEIEEDLDGEVSDINVHKIAYSDDMEAFTMTQKEKESAMDDIRDAMKSHLSLVILDWY